ncbi:reverse transcriptase domain-containing protein [Tanacetum coccineum]
MADQSDVMVSGAFISSMRPGRLFKDLIAKPPTSLEDLFTQTNKFIRAEEANNENRLQEPRRETKQHMTYKDMPRRNKDMHVSRPPKGNRGMCSKRTHGSLGKRSQKPTTTARTPRRPGTNSKRDKVSFPSITFPEDDSIPKHCTSNDPLIITADVGTTQIYRIYMDGGSSTEIMYEPCFKQLPVEEKKLGAIASTLQALMKFQTQTGIAIIKGESLQSSICNHVSQKRDQSKKSNGAEVVEHVVINDAHSDQTITIAANLLKTLKEKLYKLLRSNKHVFAWTPTDMTGIPRELAEHRLNIHPRTFLVWQKKRAMAKERSEAITTEKTDGTWHMCNEFTSLNKACLKDSYPLPKMDQKIESLEGYKLKCFLDAYKGYHQIRMAREYEEKTSFHTEQGTFCYEKMSFGLKNVGATYQLLMDNMFAGQLGRNIEIYVDDMVIKSKNEERLITDFTEIFDTLRKANMKLNPKKYTFRMESRKFLGFMITNEGIQANPEKVQAIINMASPRTLREVQALNGKLAALGRFLAKYAERSLPFFKSLKGYLNKKISNGMLKQKWLSNESLEIATIKRRCHDIHGDDVRDSVTASGHGRLKVDLEPSTW